MFPRTRSFESRVLTDITQSIKVHGCTQIDSIIFPDAFTLDKKELEVITIPENNSVKSKLLSKTSIKVNGMKS
jgi:hypothetical protein